MKKFVSALLALIMAFTLAFSVSAAEAEDCGDGLRFGGVDVSTYFSQKNSGVTYRDFNGNELDDDGFFELLHLCGVSCVRVRIWNDPYDGNGNGYGGGNCDLENACKTASLAAKHGISLFADFHLSDFWSDPEKQRAPKAWQNYSVSEKCAAIYDFITHSLNALKQSGADIEMVQVGNEINNGLCGETDFESVCAMLKSGFSAVSNFDGGVLKAVHFTNPEKNGYSWYASQLEKYGVDYDVFASSYYSYWHGTTQNLTSELKKVADGYGKYVIVAETSYPYTTQDSDFFGNTVGEDTENLNYSVSAEGQAQALRDVFEAVKAVGSSGLGVFYWEPAWTCVGTASYSENLKKWQTYGSGWESSYAAEYCDDGAKYYGGSAWDNQAMFDSSGNPLEGMNVFGEYAAAEFGDVSLDGEVNIADVTLLQKYLARITQITELQARAANDGGRDGVSVKDATKIQIFIASQK